MSADVLFISLAMLCKSLSSSGTVVEEESSGLNPFGVEEIPQEFIKAVGEDDDNVIAYVKGLNIPNLRMNHNEERIINLIDSLQEKRDDKRSKVPIIFKISPDIEDFEIKSLCEIFLEKKIDGIILTNTTVNHKENLGSDLKYEIGGLSGKPLNAVSNKIIQKFFIQLGHNIPIIGAGGVSDGHTALEKIKSGASLLQLYTSMVYSGPYVAHKINKELSFLIKKEGYKNISEAVGIYCKK